MNFFKELRKKTWIDWVKILVAIDMAFVGMGLVVNIHFHVLADSLGFLTRIPFGILYIFIAVIIFKRVFPQVREDGEMSRPEEETLEKQARSIKTLMGDCIRYCDALVDRILDFVDRMIDAIEDFFKKRYRELKDEVHKASKE